ncbi:RagB/SusD family nutrient uptake outer membrane protein [Hymenobacter sp. H14-R3]|uniref:RagB/SusD family nutrient uptake outer membrane protein n=1 Tax=Hymenobacter sp. H14-R3 TaxID=3046308 RepID=UPI0024BAF3E7|nr:RagB/SusD family nutrient uptake outer membrane protein [Hymenobacter sp. H14-R3]MDJ0363640.1 RagB/SusD family nutrient uptake outer membrane protein [Hymenobacter sp. H14-R3]
MKLTHPARLLALTALVVLSQGCKNFLDKQPLGATTQGSLFSDPVNAVQAVNAIYDAASWDEGPKWGYGDYIGHMYEWMFGDVMSDDAEKGSQPSDFTQVQDLKQWSTTPSNAITATLWSHSFTGIGRANTVINSVDGGTIDDALKSRLKGEALFFRAYNYFYLVRLFGGVPLFEQAVQPGDAANVKRASIAETYAFIEKDLKAAAALLPEKKAYAATDLGRVTKGAANAYLARVIMYELGTVNAANHTWQDVYDATSTVITSGQYGLEPNYAAIHQEIAENGTESIFEIQFAVSPEGYGPIKTGTTNNVFQNNRKTFGYGFNNPTKNLFNEFEPNDPRQLVTFIKDQDIALGVPNKIDLSENDTGYLSRKVAIIPPPQNKASGQNIRKMRYADVLLMKAEAAARLGKNGEAIALVNQVRARARMSTKPPGTVLGSTAYEPTNAPAGTLPDLNASLAGQTLLDAVWHERRVELAEETLRYWDLVRTGRYLGTLPSDASNNVRARCLTHIATETSVNPFPLLPIDLVDSQTWGLPQNPGY